MKLEPGQIRGRVIRTNGVVSVIWNGTMQSAQDWNDSPMPNNLSIRSVGIIHNLITVAQDCAGNAEFEFIQPSV